MKTVTPLIALAIALGATSAVAIPVEALAVEERFADLCAAPMRCPSYGLTPGCPPHAMRPNVFKAELELYQKVLVFKLDIPSRVLQSPARLPLARKIHSFAAALEREAHACGWTAAKALASGSCKELFCASQPNCVVLHRHLPCPHALHARPSLSAMGIDFTRLAGYVGWPLSWASQASGDIDNEAMSLLAGLVLLG